MESIVEKKRIKKKGKYNKKKIENKAKQKVHKKWGTCFVLIQVTVVGDDQVGKSGKDKKGYTDCYSFFVEFLHI